jgi:hypothetical protein
MDSKDIRRMVLHFRYVTSRGTQAEEHWVETGEGGEGHYVGSMALGMCARFVEPIVLRAEKAEATALALKTREERLEDLLRTVSQYLPPTSIGAEWVRRILAETRCTVCREPFALCEALSVDEQSACRGARERALAKVGS